MDTIKFEGPLVAERFIALVEQDREVELPGTYSGLFSKITPAMAYAMVRKGSNIIAFKEGVKDEEDAPPAEKIISEKTYSQYSPLVSGDGGE